MRSIQRLAGALDATQGRSGTGLILDRIETLAMNPTENATERYARVMRLHEQLVEIEQRLIPTGLHVFGRASELQEKADLLRMVASFDRDRKSTRLNSSHRL